eukprot:3979798-Pleurochrysis_carterae.AAC.1
MTRFPRLFRFDPPTLFFVVIAPLLPSFWPLLAQFLALACCDCLFFCLARPLSMTCKSGLSARPQHAEMSLKASDEADVRGSLRARLASEPAV